MYELSLFTGAGGGLLASHLLGWTPVGYVEYDDYCQRVIAARVRDGLLAEAPIFGDIRAFNGEGYADSYKGVVDILSAGFPCQPYSSAAQGRNRPDEIWSQTALTIRLVKPRLVFLENVQRRAIDRAATCLRDMGYRCRATPLSAEDLGADHSRLRYWLAAHAHDQGELFLRVHAEMARMPEFCPGVWSAEPDEPRVADGLANRLERPCRHVFLDDRDGFPTVCTDRTFDHEEQTARCYQDTIEDFGTRSDIDSIDSSID